MGVATDEGWSAGSGSFSENESGDTFSPRAEGVVAETHLARRAGRAHQELKGELGLHHFEDRSFPDWHHHGSVVLSGDAFIVAERVRRFSPSTGRQADDSTIPVAA